MEIVSLDTITCNQNSADVTIAVIGDDPYSAVWRHGVGTIIPSIDDGLTVSSDGVDTLTLMLTNEARGCVTCFDIIIPEDREPPLINMSPDTSINCYVDTLIISSVSPIEEHYS